MRGRFGATRTVPLLAAAAVVVVVADPYCMLASAFAFTKKHCPRLLRRTSASLACTSSSSSATEEDFARWEHMYQAGGESKAEEITSYLSSQIKVVSFDLDNTLWRTGPTIAAANEALAVYLEERYGDVPQSRTEVRMGELFRAHPDRYCPLDPTAKHPVRLTQLRKDALCDVLKSTNDDPDVGENDSKLRERVDKAFDVWMEARHDAIRNNNWAANVNECLSKISQLRTKEGQPVIVGAITDGNSDPRQIAEIGDYFSFCVNAEAVGVSKPDQRVYLQGFREALRLPALSGLLPADCSIDELSDGAVEELIGPFWIHVGDDFTKDIVAGKALKMRTVWSTELISRKLQNEDPTSSKQSGDHTVEELVAKVASQNVVKMQVGADDYLASTIQEEFADATIESFADLFDLLERWHNTSSINQEEAAASDFDINMAVSANVPTTTTSSSDAFSKRNFCTACGQRMPTKTSRFCPACGEKQC